MKVSELAQILAQLSPDAEVLVFDDEGDSFGHLEKIVLAHSGTSVGLYGGMVATPGVDLVDGSVLLAVGIYGPDYYTKG